MLVSRTRKELSLMLCKIGELQAWPLPEWNWPLQWSFLLIPSQKYDCCGTVKLKLYFNTQGQYSLLSATFSSEVNAKKLRYYYRSRSSTIKAISDFLVTIYKFYPRHTVPTDQRLSTDFNNSRLNEEKNHTYRLLALYQGTKGKRIRKTRANSLALISLWSYLKGEKRQSEIFTGNLVVSACGHNQEASHNAQFSLFEIFLSFIPSHLRNLERFCHSGW